MMPTDDGGLAAARYARERAFHDERFRGADDDRLAAEKYYAVDAGIVRYREILASVGASDRVLEYGCGPGSAGFDLARRGAEVVGIDISPAAIEAARGSAAAEGLSNLRFAVMNAECLEFAAGSFDVVCGSGILHHLDLERAYREVHRVLRPSGWAVFYEPMGTNPAIRLYRRLTPKMRTPDEHPLLFSDVDAARSHFRSVGTEFFNFFVLAAVFFRRLPGSAGLVRLLQRCDRWLFARVPPARRLAWVVVLTLRETVA